MKYLLLTALILVGCGGSNIESDEKREAFMKGHRIAYFEACLALQGELDHPIFSLTQEEIFNSRDSVLSFLLFEALASEKCEEVAAIHREQSKETEQTRIIDTLQVEWGADGVGRTEGGFTLQPGESVIIEAFPPVDEYLEELDILGGSQ